MVSAPPPIPTDVVTHSERELVFTGKPHPLPQVGTTPAFTNFGGSLRKTTKFDLVTVMWSETVGLRTRPV